MMIPVKAIANIWGVSELAIHRPRIHGKVKSRAVSRPEAVLIDTDEIKAYFESNPEELARLREKPKDRATTGGRPE